MAKKVVIESMYLYNYYSPQNGVTVGGTQRYTLDLGRLFYGLGYEVVFVTKANTAMTESYEDWATVVALDSPYGSRGSIDFSRRVYSFCRKLKPDLVCYSDLQIGFPYCYENSFALQHGIAWDNPNQKLKWLVKSQFYARAMRNFKLIICVDTNFINWCRERDRYYFHNRDKLVYIPNYADEEQFAYSYREWGQDERFVLLYPRRLVPHRGYHIFVAMCERLLARGYDIVPVLAFEDFRDKDFERAYPQYKDLECIVVHPRMNEIQRYYRDAFLTFVPSLWSEGTSLSAIESMCTGTPVIASDVGGLGNIILPGFNGWLVTPTVESFVNITERLLQDVGLRNRMAQNCRYMNEIFGKKRWESQVYEAIKHMLQTQS